MRHIVRNVLVEMENFDKEIRIYLVDKLGLPSLNDMIMDLVDGWTESIKKSIEDFMNIKVIIKESKIKFTEE